MTCYIEEIPHYIISGYISRSIAGQKEYDDILKVLNGKKTCHPKILYLEKLCFKSKEKYLAT